MTNVITTQREKKSILLAMAERFEMEPGAFQSTVMKTVMPNGGKNISNEEFASFLLVAKEYKLNPLVKEIYAFPARGGIQPVVGVDGWIRIINDHPQFDGYEFEDIIVDKELIAIECKIYRKDRSHAVSATEYMAECKGTSEPWKKWPRRMLRHKALIQCARYAFGFSGIVDPDEAERIKDVTPPKPNTELKEAFLNKSNNTPPEEESIDMLDDLFAKANKQEEKSQRTNLMEQIKQKEESQSPAERKASEIITSLSECNTEQDAQKLREENQQHFDVMDDELYAKIDKEFQFKINNLKEGL